MASSSQYGVAQKSEHGTYLHESHPRTAHSILRCLEGYYERACPGVQCLVPREISMSLASSYGGSCSECLYEDLPELLFRKSRYNEVVNR